MSEECALAVAAIVIEELDDRHIALRIAERNVIGRGEDSLLVVGDRALRLGLLLRFLLLLQGFLHFDQDFRVLDEILLNEVADFLLLRIVEGEGRERRCDRECESDGGRKLRLECHVCPVLVVMRR
jgi:hypothetical protein